MAGIVPKQMNAAFLSRVFLIERLLELCTIAGVRTALRIPGVNHDWASLLWVPYFGLSWQS